MKLKKRLCLKYCGKWREILYFKRTTNEYVIVLSYYSNGTPLCTKTVINSNPKLKIKTIKN